MYDYQNDNIQEFYNQLVELCDKSNVFFYIDQDIEVNGNKYKVRIFSYRSTEWSDWVNNAPYSYWCRGTTFEFLDDGRVRLVSLPFRKFFNYNENPSTSFEALKDKEIAWVAEKHDGSLISTVNLSKDISLKTRQSFHSDQAIAVKQNYEFYYADSDHQFVDYEYVAPNNQIVLFYEKPKLIELERRQLTNKEPESLLWWKVKEYLPELKCWLLTFFHGDQAFPRKLGLTYYKPLANNIEELYIKDRTNYEGVVVTFQDGTKVKYKTDWYCSLHKVRDQTNNMKFKLEVILNDGVDDLLGKLGDEFDKHILGLQKQVNQYIEQRDKSINDFHWNNEKLSRKNFAIKAKEQLTQSKHDFCCVMVLFGNRYAEFCFKQYMKDNLDKFTKNNELVLE